MAFSAFRSKRVVYQSKPYSQEAEPHWLERTTGGPLTDPCSREIQLERVAQGHVQLQFECLDVPVEIPQSLWAMSYSVCPLSW